MSSSNSAIQKKPLDYYKAFRQGYSLVFHTGVIGKKMKWLGAVSGFLAITLLIVSILSLLSHGGVVHIGALTFSIHISYSLFALSMSIFSIQSILTLYLFEKSKKTKKFLHTNMLLALTPLKSDKFSKLEYLLRDCMKSLGGNWWHIKPLGDNCFAVCLSVYDCGVHRGELHLFPTLEAAKAFVEALKHKYSVYKGPT